MSKFFLDQAKSAKLQGKFSDINKENKRFVLNVHFNNFYSLVAFKFLKTKTWTSLEIVQKHRISEFN